MQLTQLNNISVSFVFARCGRLMHSLCIVCHCRRSCHSGVELLSRRSRKRAKIDALKNGDWTPLMLACTKVGNSALETIKVLLENGANISLKNKDGWSPLHIAARQGDTDIISHLLSHNADVSAVTKSGRSVLHIAALNSRVNALELLLNHGDLTVDSKDSQGITPFLGAAIGGSVESAQLLKSKGAFPAEVNAMGLSGLHLAAESGHAAMVKYLVEECGMNVNLQAKGSDVTPLHCASKAGQKSTAKVLLDLGADVKLMAKDGWAESCSAYGAEEEERRYMCEEIMNLFVQ